MKPETNDEKEIRRSKKDANRDRLSGAAESHPLGAGAGALAGGAIGGVAVGAAIGTVAGPVGTVVGAATGAIVGGVAGAMGGKAIAEIIDPTVEHGFWQSAYVSRPYAQTGVTFEQYEAAYQYGWESRAFYHDKTFDQVELNLGRDWPTHRGKSALVWEQAKQAVRDSWDRVDKKLASSKK
ncbi:MAG: hypothetical protein HKL96_02260 [Phycisphaerales bacterium]|nr:hypothetical protein [Phycisphaerales bacterium]